MKRKRLLIILYILGAASLFINTNTALIEAQAETEENEGRLLIRDEKWEAALEYYLNNLEGQIQKYREKSVSTATFYNDMGLIYSNLGDNDTAIGYYRRAVECCGDLGDDPQKIIAYSGIAECYGDKQEYDTALYYIRKAQEITRRSYGERSIYYASVLNKISYLYNCKGEHQIALELEKKAIEIFENTPYEKENDIIDTYYMRAGHICFQGGDYENAGYYYSKALEIRKKLFGEEHDRTAESYLAYGRAIAKEQPKTARHYFEHALTIYEQAENYVKYRAIVLKNIAWSYSIENNTEKAIEYAALAYQRAVEYEMEADSYKEYIKEIYNSRGIGKAEEFEQWLQKWISKES